MRPITEKSSFTGMHIGWVAAYLMLVANNVSSAPILGEIVAGSANVSEGGNTVVNQSSQHVAIDWKQFDIAGGESVQFIQPNANSIALNRDVSGNPSELFGSLTANGQIMLLNSSGILIGRGSNINVGSLLVSDLHLSVESMAKFVDSGARTDLAFSDEDLASGGITLLGDIVTTGASGITLLGQYLFLEAGSTLSQEGNANSPYGNTDFIVGGSAILVTDPNGYYGVEIGSIAPIERDISPNGKLIEASEVPGQTVFRTINGDINFVVRHYADENLIPLSIREQSVQILGDGITNRDVTAFQRPPRIDSHIQVEIEDTLADNLNEEPIAKPETSSTGTSTEKARSTLDSYITGCEPVDRNDRDCIRQNAIKHYLGKLLIGGSLPD